MKDAESAESKENQISDFFFRVVVIFVLKTVNFRWIFTKTRKIKIRKIRKLIFHSFQHILHLSCNIEHFWRRRWGSGLPHLLMSSIKSCISISDVLRKLFREMIFLEFIQRNMMRITTFIWFSKNFRTTFKSD